MRFAAPAFFLALALAAAPAWANPPDDIADAIVAAGTKTITADSLPDDFARLTKFVRHDVNGMVLYSDGGSTDGYVRHAQARFNTTKGPAAAGIKAPLFSVAFELVNQENFTFEGFAAAMAQRLGTPSSSSNQGENTFRTWSPKQPEGRTITVAESKASDNGDPITVVYLTQN